VIDDWTSVLTHAPRSDGAREIAPDAFSADELTRALDANRRAHERVAPISAATAAPRPSSTPRTTLLLLRAWQLRSGRCRAERPALRYRHVAVDEVQDFSPLEIQVLLGCLDQRQSITLAGDTQQHLLENSGFTSWATFFAQLGSAAPRSTRSR
jgi:hypothetical protein